MRAVDIILKKRRGDRLTRGEIEDFVTRYVSGEIPDYQMAAFLMAVCFQGMDAEETVGLTIAMMNSGDQVSLEGIDGLTVDKHSTGGVGDKTTLVLAPLLASAGLKVAKMSGRGLGHTGGTLDKLESLPGFRIDLDADSFRRQVNETGLAVISQTGNLVPADKKMYSLRDVTGTVDEISLISASIMSKKMVVDNDALVLDVKVGSGAFMKTIEDARKLAESMVSIGKGMNRKLSALITEMSQPLGHAVGNALEVQEAIDCLSGGGPSDLRELVVSLAAELLLHTDRVVDRPSGVERAAELLDSGKALEAFHAFVTAQGGEPEAWNKLPQADRIVDVVWQGDRTNVAGIDSEQVGRAAMLLGAGRETKDSVIDLAVGLTFEIKIGDILDKEARFARLHVRDHHDDEVINRARAVLVEAITGSNEAVSSPPIVHQIVD